MKVEPKQRIRLAELDLTQPDETHPLANLPARLNVVIFPSKFAPVIKQFWQHSGEGISSRFAQHALRVLEESEAASLQGPGVRGSGTNPRYRLGAYRLDVQQAALQNADERVAARDEELFVEERFGRNLEVTDADNAKVMLKKRIAGIVGDALDASDSGDPDCPNDNCGASNCNSSSAVTHGNIPSTAVDHDSIRGITENDVFLFPSGMSAVYNANRLVRTLFPGRKSVQFG